MAGASLREQAFGLLAAANNHGDLAVKLSSLKQAKHVLLSLDAASAGELLPFLADLHSSPECLVRQLLVEIMEDIALREMKHSSVFMPALLALLKDGNYNVARQSVFCGTKLFCCILEAMALQFHQHGKVERWLEELWMWMVKFKDVVFSIAFEPGSVGMRLLALKFLETYVLLFTSDTSDFETSKKEGRRRSFNISWLGGHPILDPVLLFSEANRTLDIFLDLLRSASSLPGTLTIVTVNCLETGCSTSSTASLWYYCSMLISSLMRRYSCIGGSDNWSYSLYNVRLHCLILRSTIGQ